MRFLIDRQSAAAAGLRVLARYPAWVLAEADAVPPDTLEVLNSDEVTVLGRSMSVPEGSFPAEASLRYVIRFIGPVASEWRQALEAAGVTVHFWCPRFGACVGLPKSIAAADLGRRFAFVVGAVPLEEAHCERVPPETRAAGMPPGLVDIVCFTREDTARVGEALRAMGAEVVASGTTKLRVAYPGSLAALRDLAGVKLVESVRGHRLSDAPMARALGAAAADGGWLEGLDGDGELIAVADSGLDGGSTTSPLHADFSGRVRQLASWPIDASWASYVAEPGRDDGGADRNSGHGTVVAGLALGDGARSQGRHRGVAPRAGLVFQALEQYTAIRPAYAAQLPSGFYLSGRPLDLRDLFQQARDFGARIHVNAWGDPAAGAYTNDCFEADHFLHQHDDALILFAAGNDGADRDGNRRPDGGRLDAPGTAKNVLTIGATEGPQAGVGYRGTWGQFDADGRRFANARDRADPVSGDGDRLALFSAGGPTGDGRIKPDLCAPGTNVCGPRSSLAIRQGWGLADPLPFYMYMGGTSMATGLAGGAAAVVRQAWRRESGGGAPSGAALKALLILGAQPVLSRGSDTPELRASSGFGRIAIAASLPRSPGGPRILHDTTDPGLETGGVREFVFETSAPGPCSAVLCWYDAPGETLVNDLDLRLEGAGGIQRWGNHPPGEPGTPDRCNTVETVVCEDLAPGRHTLRVVAANVPAGPQAYALVVAAPSFTMSGSGIGVAIGRLSRIGGAAAALQRAGIAYAHQLRGMEPAAIAAAGGLSPARLMRLVGQIGALAAARLHPFVQGLDESLTWQSARGAAAPQGLTPDQETSGRAALSAALVAVPRRWHARLRIADLRV